MDPNQNPPSERQWTPEEMEEFFSSQDAVTGLFPSGAVASNGPMTCSNEPITLQSLTEMHDKFKEAFPIPTAFKDGADMSCATFDELGKSIKMLRPQGQAWLGISTDNFIGREIHIVNSVPFGAVEECRCKERTFRKDFIEGMEAVQRLMKEDTP